MDAPPPPLENKMHSIYSFSCGRSQLKGFSGSCERALVVRERRERVQPRPVTEQVVQLQCIFLHSSQ